MLKHSNDIEIKSMARLDLREARQQNRLLIRRFHHSEDIKRERDSFNILSSTASFSFAKSKASNLGNPGQVPYLSTGAKKYVDSIIT